MARHKILICIFFILLVLTLNVTAKEVKYKDLDHENSFGKVKFNKEINSNKNIILLKSAIKIKEKEISINSKFYSELNQPATLTFKNANLNNPIAVRNGVWQKDIKVKKVALNTFQFDVKGFSTWTLEENLWNGTLTNLTIVKGNLTLDYDVNYNLPLQNNITNVTLTDTTIRQINTTLPLYHSLRNTDNHAMWYFELFRVSGLGGLRLDGATNYLTSVDIAMNGVNFSVMALLSIDSTFGNNGSLVAKSTGTGTTRNWDFKLTSNRTLFFEVAQSDDTIIQVQATEPVSATFADHMAGVANGTHLVLYIGGVENASTPYDGTMKDDAGVAVTVGAKQGGSEVLVGIIDEVITFDGALTSQEIADVRANIFIGQPNTLHKPVFHYFNFDQSNGTLVDAGVNASHGGTFNFKERPVSNKTSGIYGAGSYVFHGSNSGIVTEESTNFNYLTGENVTLSAYVKADGLTTPASGVMPIVAIEDSGGSSKSTSIYVGPGNVFSSQARWGASQVASSSVTSNDSKWHHVLITFQYMPGVNDDELRLYVDGTQVGSRLDKDQSTEPTDMLVVGESSFSALFNEDFKGEIAGVQYFKRVLRLDEILSLNSTVQNKTTLNKGSYISSIHNVSDYDTEIVQNIWHNITFNATTDITDISIRTGNCTNVTNSSWVDYTVTSGFSDFGMTNEGRCFQYRIYPESTPNIDQFSNYSIQSQKYVRGLMINLDIGMGTYFANDTIIGNATVTLNDTDAVSVIYRWYKNGALSSTVILTNLLNGTNTTNNFTNYVRSDIIFFTVQANNTGVLSSIEQSENITIGNLNYSFDYAPTNLSPTINFLRNRRFDIIFTDDVDDDAEVQWFENGLLVESGDFYIFKSSPYEFFEIISLVANISDGEFNTTVTWSIEISETDVDVSVGLPIILFLIFISIVIFALAARGKFTRHEFSNRLIQRGFISVGIFMTMWNFSILSTITQAGGLNLVSDILRYMVLFGWAGYFYVGFVVISTFFDIRKHYQVKKQKERFGDDEDNF